MVEAFCLAFLLKQQTPFLVFTMKLSEDHQSSINMTVLVKLLE